MFRGHLETPALSVLSKITTDSIYDISQMFTEIFANKYFNKFNNLKTETQAIRQENSTFDNGPLDLKVGQRFPGIENEQATTIVTIENSCAKESEMSTS